MGPMHPSRSSLLLGTAAWLLVVVLVGFVDLVTGPDYGFGFFYLLAIVPAAWSLGRGSGYAVAIASGFAWFSADLLERRVGVLAIAWNASSRTLLFFLAAYLVDSVRRERERLRGLDEERSYFMRVLEHELAGPGRALADGLRRLQQRGSATPEDLQPLVEQAQDLEFLSRDFVSLGELQSGQLWLHHQPVDLRAIVEELRTRVAKDGTKLPLTLATGAFVVEGDEARLRQAIAGVLDETRDSAGAQDVTLDLRRERGRAKLTISAGVGPFLTPPRDDQRGVGVELARRIIEAHHGQFDYRREAVSKAIRVVLQVPLAT